MRPSRLVGALAGLCVLLPSPVAGQAPAERHAIASLIDTLGALTDTVSLRRREAALDRTAKARDSALARVRLGLVRLRLAQLGASPDAKSAVRVLRQATERRPRWPYAWYALGLAEAQRAAPKS